MQVTVVGAGVVGLTAALRLAQAGHAVQVVTADRPEQTTSSVAAAIWYPYRAMPQDRVTAWAGVTFRVLQQLSADPTAGVAMRAGRELFRTPVPDPWWRRAVPALDRVDRDELPAGYADGYRLVVPVIDMPVHLAWLVEQLQELAVGVEQRRLSGLDEAAGDVVVHCSGLGAELLALDPTLVPVRGQVVVVEQVGVSEWLLDESDEAELTYVVPRGDTVVLGGTAEVGVRDVEPDAAAAGRVHERCLALVPALTGARVLSTRAGLRPTRPAVRLEAGQLPSGRPVVHCYGHGGAGVTLSYGCADDVVRLVEAL